MQVNDILSYLNDEYNLGIKKYEEFDESSDNSSYDFNKIYQWEMFNFKKRLRIVKYKNSDSVIVFKGYMKISNILYNEFTKGRQVYTKDKEFKIPYKELLQNINRINKLKKIASKI